MQIVIDWCLYDNDDDDDDSSGGSYDIVRLDRMNRAFIRKVHRTDSTLENFSCYSSGIFCRAFMGMA